jgi:multicomponent Na+:H+ antiporter subunit G
MTTLGWIMIMAGCIVVLIAAFGLFRLGDAMSRQHSATKAGTLGLGLMLAGAACVGGDWAWGGRILAILAILFVTLPVASHMLARAAARQQFSREEIDRAPRYPPPEARCPASVDERQNELKRETE